MSGVDPTQRLLSQIRAVISSRADRGRDSKRSSGSSPTDAARLTDDLRILVRDLDFGSDEGRRRGRRSFLEIVLLDEFGITLADDPKFIAIVEKVDDAISAEDDLREELDRALKMLQAQPG